MKASVVGASRNKQTIILVFLLVVELAYVAVEFGFNAGILNIASLAVNAGENAATNLEQFGQKLSGVGLGLLVLGVLIQRRRSTPSVRRIVIASVIIFPITIATMTAAQRALIYDYIPDNASPQEKYAATFTQYLTPAIRNGMISIDGIPITPETLSRPESKAFLTLLAPALMHNTPVVRQIATHSGDIIKMQAHRAATQRSDALFKVYQEGMENIDADDLYDEYKDASAFQEYSLKKELGKLRTSQKLKGFNFLAGRHWTQYTQSRNVRPGKYPPPGLSATEFAAHPKVLKLLAVNDSETRQKIGPQHFRIKRGYRAGEWRYDSFEAVAVIARQAAKKEFQKEWRAESKKRTNWGGPDIALGLSKSEFFRSDWMQGLIRRFADLPGDRPIIPGYTQAQFFEEYLIPSTWEEVRKIQSNLPDSIDDIDQDSGALSAIYGPAIALTVSLFFSMLTLGKAIGRVWKITAHHRRIPRPTARKVGWAINGITLALIIGLPVALTSNSLAQSEVIEAAASSNTSSITTKVMRWTLDMEPIIFPLGNALLPYIEIGDLHRFHDQDAGASHTSAASGALTKLDLSVPLSVSGLQRTLAQKGFSPGPIDGVIGKGTISALKRFQKANSLNVTGTQNLETIRALRRQ